MTDYLTIYETDALAVAGWYSEPGNVWVSRVFEYHCSHHAADFEVCDAAICIKARAAEVAAHAKLKADFEDANGNLIKNDDITAALDRDALGRVAHETWRAWCATRAAQGFYGRWRDTTWEDLPEPTREAYRVVAEAVAQAVQGTQL